MVDIEKEMTRFHGTVQEDMFRCTKQAVLTFRDGSMLVAWRPKVRRRTTGATFVE